MHHNTTIHKGYSILLARIRVKPENYHAILVEHKTTLLMAIKKQGQTKTAEDLGISQAKLSSIAQILNAMDTAPYRVYYVLFNYNGLVYSKIGYSNNIIKRLTRFNHIHTIESWNMSKETAIEAEALIKSKYKHLTLDLTDHKKYDNCIDNTEMFDRDILSKSDRAYLASMKAN